MNVNDHINKMLSKNFGCSNCEVLYKGKCTIKGSPLGIGKICDFRLGWLNTLLPDYTELPSLYRLRRDLITALKMHRANKDQVWMSRFEKEMETVMSLKDSCDDPDELKTLNKRYDSAENNFRKFKRDWEGLLKTVLNYEDQQVNRDTTKKHEHLQIPIKPSDVTNLIKQARGMVIEPDKLNHDDKRE